MSADPQAEEPQEHPKSARHAYAASVRAAGKTPDERSAEMSKLAKKRWARFRAEQAAAGIAPAPRSNTMRPMPTPDELEPYLAEIDAEPREVPLTYDQRIREAALRVRRDIAKATHEALRREGER